MTSPPGEPSAAAAVVAPRTIAVGLPTSPPHKQLKAARSSEQPSKAAGGSTTSNHRALEWLMLAQKRADALNSKLKVSSQHHHGLETVETSTDNFIASFCFLLRVCFVCLFVCLFVFPLSSLSFGCCLTGFGLFALFLFFCPNSLGNEKLEDRIVRSVRYGLEKAAGYGLCRADVRRLATVHDVTEEQSRGIQTAKATIAPEGDIHGLAEPLFAKKEFEEDRICHSLPKG